MRTQLSVRRYRLTKEQLRFMRVDPHEKSLIQNFGAI